MAMLDKSRPDVVLLDVVLPGISGYEVCRMVRAGEGGHASVGPRRPDHHAERERGAHGPGPGLTRGTDDYVTTMESDPNRRPGRRPGSASAKGRNGYHQSMPGTTPLNASDSPGVDPLLAEQVAYYEARAPEYDRMLDAGNGYNDALGGLTSTV